MTLKEFLDSHNINPSRKQRAMIGQVISQPLKNRVKVPENYYMVVDYDSEYLNSEKVITQIMDVLNN